MCALDLITMCVCVWVLVLSSRNTAAFLLYNSHRINTLYGNQASAFKACKLNWGIFKKKNLSSNNVSAPPLESTHQKLSFEWSHL